MLEAKIPLPPIVVSKSIEQKTLEALERIENRLGDLLSAYLAVNGAGRVTDPSHPMTISKPKRKRGE